MAPKYIPRISIFRNMTATQASAYLSDLLRDLTAEGVVLFADDILAIKVLIDKQAELEKYKKKN